MGDIPRRIKRMTIKLMFIIVSPLTLAVRSMSSAVSCFRTGEYNKTNKNRITIYTRVILLTLRMGEYNDTNKNKTDLLLFSLWRCVVCLRPFRIAERVIYLV